MGMTAFSSWVRADTVVSKHPKKVMNCRIVPNFVKLLAKS